MIYKRPFRLTTLHLEQRGRIDDDTFMMLPSSLHCCWFYQHSKVLIIPVLLILVQSYITVKMKGSPSVIATECSK